MNVELNRLSTFSEWPANAAVDAVRIAKAGFYYTGRGLEVQCFLCGSKISDWNYGDQAMVRHRLAEPTCPFVVDSASTCNVPFLPASSNGTVEMSTTVPSNSRQSNVIKGYAAAMQEHVVRSANPRLDYATISQRLGSFKNWPVPSIVSPERLAKAGFYYLQFNDLVECAFCSGVLTKWHSGDDPDKEHRIHFPNCDFYMRQEAGNDVLELANVTLMPGTTADLTELKIQTHTGPRSSKNAVYEERLQTFQEWPTDHPQTPEMLSAAGFYYTGIEDQVRCFHCDGALRNWEPKDDVWFEHARWFPTCTFVNLVRGPEFIKYCLDNRPPLDPEIFEGVRDEDADSVTESPVASVPIVPHSNPRSVTDTTIMKLLDTAPALAALEIGLSIDRVKRALKRRIEEYGISYSSAEELIEDVLRDQTMEEYTSITPDPSSPESVNSVDQIVGHVNNDGSLSDTGSVNSEISKDDESTVCESKKQESDVHAPDEKGNPERKKTDSKSSSITLQEENRRLKEARLCKICMDDEVAIVFLPCGHLATCVLCAPSLTYCPMCRVKIRASVRIFLS